MTKQKRMLISCLFVVLTSVLFSCSGAPNQALPTIAIIPTVLPTLTATRQIDVIPPTLTAIPTASRLDHEMTAVYSDPTLIADLVDSPSADYQTVEGLNDFLDFALRLNAYGRVLDPIIEDGLAVPNVENHLNVITWDAADLSWFGASYNYTLTDDNQCVVDDFYDHAASVLCQIRDTGYSGSMEFTLEANKADDSLCFGVIFCLSPREVAHLDCTNPSAINIESFIGHCN